VVVPTPDEALTEYREKRDFTRTAEPAGTIAEPAVARPIFCVQKHAASSLHYDLRLELAGVLKSWAVPKGPSLDPAEKRLAVQVEDHPLDYADFEGTIPEGEYGGGTVLLWDTGWWEPDLVWGAGKAAEKKEGVSFDAAAALAKGELKFVLHGRKLTGSWVVVQMKGRGPKNWLLLKHRDEAARPGGDILAERPESVSSGRTIEQIRDEEGRGHP
jgi:bifunctional non-homologous end joining protein LigD